MSEVLEGLLQKRASLSAELRALDAGIAAYRRALLPTKSAAVQVKVSGTRPTMSLAARRKLSLLAKARWAKKRKEEKKKKIARTDAARRSIRWAFCCSGQCRRALFLAST